MSKYGNHQLFLKQVMLYVHEEYKGIRLWEIATGQAYAKFSVTSAMKELIATKNMMNAMKELIIIVYGKIGHPDLTGIYYGRWIGVEIKTGNAKQSKDQKNFEQMIKDKNGIYLVVSNKYSIESQLSELNEMRRICST